MRLEEAEGNLSEDFPYPTGRFTVSGLRVGGICFECECRILQFACEDIRLAWCECGFPEDHHGMEILEA